MSVKVFIIRVNNSHILTMKNPNRRDAALLHKINHRLFVFIHAQEREILSLADHRAAEDRTLHQSQRCKCDSCIWHVLSLEFVKVVRGGTWASLEMVLRPCTLNCLQDSAESSNCSVFNGGRGGGTKMRCRRNETKVVEEEYTCTSECVCNLHAYCSLFTLTNDLC